MKVNVSYQKSTKPIYKLVGGREFESPTSTMST
jgi:hypothetical protein